MTSKVFQIASRREQLQNSRKNCAGRSITRTFSGEFLRATIVIDGNDNQKICDMPKYGQNESLLLQSHLKILVLPTKWTFRNFQKLGMWLLGSISVNEINILGSSINGRLNVLGPRSSCCFTRVIASNGEKTSLFQLMLRIQASAIRIVTSRCSYDREVLSECNFTPQKQILISLSWCRIQPTISAEEKGGLRA